MKRTLLTILTLGFMVAAVFAAPATSYTVTNYWSSGSMMYFYSVPNGTFTGDVNLSDNGAGGTFSPDKLTWAGDTSYKYFTYTNTTASALTITYSNNGGLSDPAPLAIPSASAYSAVISSVNGTAVNLSVTPNGRFTGSITYSDGGSGGSFTPASLAWTVSSSAQNVTYTATGSNSVTLSFSNDAGLVNPAALAMNGIKNPYYNWCAWKDWNTDSTPVTDTSLTTYGGAPYSQVGRCLPCAAADRLYPDDAVLPKYLAYRTGEFAGRKYAGNWDDVYATYDGAHSFLYPGWDDGAGNRWSGDTPSPFGQMMLLYGGSDVKKFGINYTSQSTTGMGHDMANSYWNVAEVEKNYYFANCLRAGVAYISFQEEKADRMTDLFQAYVPSFFDSLGASGTEVNALRKMVVAGGYLPIDIKKELK